MACVTTGRCGWCTTGTGAATATAERGGDDRPRQCGPVARVVGEERLDSIRVKLGAGLLAQDVDRLLVRRRVAVGTGRGDRVERVGHRDDPGPQRDVLTAKAVGIAGAVEALMVMADDPGELGIAQRGDHLGAVDWMALDHFEFLVGQASRLVEDGLRRSELPDVVNRGGGPNPGHILAGEAQPARDHRGVPRHSPRVPVQVDVLALEGTGQLPEQMLAVLDAELIPRVGSRAARVDEVEEPGGIGQLALLAPAPEPSPQQQLAEQHLAVPAALAPVGAAGGRGGQRHRDGQPDRHPPRDHAAGAEREGDEQGEDRDQRRRDEHLRQVAPGPRRDVVADDPDRRIQLLRGSGRRLERAHRWAINQQTSAIHSSTCLPVLINPSVACGET